MIQKVSVLTVGFCLLVCANVFASSGFVVTYQGAKASGMADAFIAQADDPTANYYNPAGLAGLAGTQFSMGMILAYQTPWEFEGEVNDGTGNYISASEEARDNVLVAPHLYLSHHFDNDFAFGLGVTASYPLSVAWNTGDMLSAYSHENNMLPLTINPNLAYSFDDIGLSLGIGVSYTYVFVSAENVAPAGALGVGTPATYSRAEMTGGGFGYNLGLKWDANDWLTLAATYRGKVEIDLSGDIRGTTTTGTGWISYLDMDIDKDVTLPAMWVLGAAFKPRDNVVVEFDVQRTEFSTYEGPFGNWEDVWAYRLGVQYSLNKNWDLRAGYAFDENPIPDEVVGPDLPDSDRHTVTLGFGYHVDNLSFDMSVGDMHCSTRHVDNNIQRGSYSLDVPFTQMTVTMKF